MIAKCMTVDLLLVLQCNNLSNKNFGMETLRKAVLSKTACLKPFAKEVL